MENILYTHRDFTQDSSIHLFTPEFDLFQDRIVVCNYNFLFELYDAETGLGGYYFYPEDVKAVFIKKNLFSSSYKVSFKISHRHFFERIPFFLNTVTLANNLKKENAILLEKIILDFKNKVPLKGVEYSFQEGLEYKNNERGKWVGDAMNITLPKILKIVVYAGVPVLIVLLFILYSLLHKV